MERRGFLQSVLSGTAVAAFGKVAPAGTSTKAEVVRVEGAAVRTGKHQFDTARLSGMLDRTMMRLTNTDTPEKAWRGLFSPKDVVGLKLNCLAGRYLSTHPVFVE